MKKLMLVAIAFLGIHASAQKRDHQQDKTQMHKRGEHFKNMSAEDVATLQTKRMTLDLDLTKAQQEKMYVIHLERTKERKAKREQRNTAKKANFEQSKKNTFDNLNTHLDKKIAHKNEMKSILDEEQYQKWERSQKRKGMKRKHKKRRTERQN